MIQYEFRDVFKDASRFYGVRPKHAIRVIENAHYTEHFKAGDLPEVYLSIAPAEGARPPRHLLVTWSEFEDASRRFVHAAWPIPATVVDSQDPKPFEALQALCDRVGVPLRIDGKAEGNLLRDIAGTVASDDADRIVEMGSDPRTIKTFGVPGIEPPPMGQLVMHVSDDRTAYHLGIAYVLHGALYAELLHQYRQEKR